jgi:ADP-heptose:LPS heptosyltransferase
LIWYDHNHELVPFSSMRRIIKEKSFDSAIVVYPRLRLAWLMFRSGIPLRIGTGYRYYSFLFNRRVYEHRRDAKRHEVEYNLNLLAELGCSVPQEEMKFEIDIPPELQARVERLLYLLRVDRTKELIVIHPGSGGSAREWPVEFFGLLAVKLITERGAQIIVTGGKGEERKVAAVLLATRGLAIPLVNKLGLKELASLVRSAHLFISNSTGPLHLAVAMGTPVVGLFPQIIPLSARRWGPYTDKKKVLIPDKPVDCTDCIHTKGEQCACMQSISVDEAYDAACSMLADRSPHEGRSVTNV